MSMTVGRASLTTDPSSISFDGDTLTLGFDILPSTLAEAKALRQQILGLANNADEPVIPVTWSGDSDLDGFYRVESVSVAPEQTYLFNNLMRASVTLERVGGGFAKPRVDMAFVGVVRPTAAHNPASKVAGIWIPDAWAWQQFGTVASFDRVTETGTVQSTATPTTDLGNAAAYGIAPADFYAGACLIEQSVGGTWYPVVGRHVPAGAIGGIRLSNSLVRVTWQTDGDLELEVWDGTSAWDAVTDITLKNSGSVLVPRSVPTVIMNTPNRCSLRWPTHGASSLLTTRFVTLSVRRGDLVIDGVWETSGLVWEFGAKSTTAATSITGAIHQTSNGAAGHRWVVGSSNAYSELLASGLITSSAQDVLPFFIGVNLNGTGSTAYDEPADLVTQWWESISDRQEVVAS